MLSGSDLLWSRSWEGAASSEPGQEERKDTEGLCEYLGGDGGPWRDSLGSQEAGGRQELSNESSE